MISHPARFASILAVLMLGIGSCCCQGALVAGLLPHGKSCCEKQKPVQPANQHDDCHCSGRVLTEGKVDAVSGLPSLPKPATDLRDVFQPDFVSCAPPLLASLPAVAHAPPPRFLRSFLQVWLI